MLKRTMILLSLTITVGALLLVVGCGGHNATMLSTTAENESLMSRGNTPPNAPVLIAPSNNATINWYLVTFQMSSTDSDLGAKLRFKVLIYRNGKLFAFADQTRSVTGWSKPYYNSGEVATLRMLFGAGTYEWEAYAFDGISWSPVSERRTFSIQPQ